MAQIATFNAQLGISDIFRMLIWVSYIFNAWVSSHSLILGVLLRLKNSLQYPRAPFFRSIQFMFILFVFAVCHD